MNRDLFVEFLDVRRANVWDLLHHVDDVGEFGAENFVGLDAECDESGLIAVVLAVELECLENGDDDVGGESGSEELFGGEESNNGGGELSGLQTAHAVVP